MPNEPSSLGSAWSALHPPPDAVGQVASGAGASGAGAFFFGGGTPTEGAVSAHSGQRRRLTMLSVRSSFIATSSS